MKKGMIIVVILCVRLYRSELLYESQVAFIKKSMFSTVISKRTRQVQRVIEPKSLKFQRRIFYLTWRTRVYDQMFVTPFRSYGPRTEIYKYTSKYDSVYNTTFGVFLYKQGVIYTSLLCGMKKKFIRVAWCDLKTKNIILIIFSTKRNSAAQYRVN